MSAKRAKFSRLIQQKKQRIDKLSIEKGNLEDKIDQIKTTSNKKPEKQSIRSDTVEYKTLLKHIVDGRHRIEQLK